MESLGQAVGVQCQQGTGQQLRTWGIESWSAARLQFLVHPEKLPTSDRKVTVDLDTAKLVCADPLKPLSKLVWCYRPKQNMKLKQG